VGNKIPYLYIYSPDDFIGGLPDEVDAQADGSPSFSLQLKPGATPTLVEVTDEDIIFDEVDGSQELTHDIDLDGTSYAAGTTINSSYDLINTTTGHKVTSLHFGGDGYQQGAVAGLASTVELVEGETYTFDTERTSHEEDNYYEDYVACFTTGARVETKRGLVEVQNLCIGDQILTADNGYQPLKMLCQRRIGTAELRAKSNLLPVCITRGALGQDLPARDLRVSPQHRFVVNSPISKRMFGNREVLISAKKMTALPGIYVDDSVEDITYYHLVLDAHEVIYVEYTPTESFFFGPMALAALSKAARDEIYAIFPALMDADFQPSSAREIPSNKRQKHFMGRHEHNNKPVLLPTR